ncbi:hypothetical protein [Intrasporangium sp.]|uniref:hypothetical protein n=1 Tax=Intrasporangium sp. TaxID=1925024 RepID=UPI003221D963
MSFTLVTADERLLEPVYRTAVEEFAAAAAASNSYLLQYDPRRGAGRHVAMPPGPSRTGQAIREVDGSFLVLPARGRADGPWAQATAELTRTFERCRAARLPGAFTAYRVLPGGRHTIGYRIDVRVGTAPGAPSYTALFQRPT